MWNIDVWLDQLLNELNTHESIPGPPVGTAKSTKGKRKRDTSAPYEREATAAPLSKRRKHLAPLDHNVRIETKMLRKGGGGKRRRAEDVMEVDEAEMETPRQDQRWTAPPLLPRADSESSPSAASSSRASRSLSPSKRSRRRDAVDLQLIDAPISFRTREDARLPACMNPVIHAIDDINDASQLVPACLVPPIAQHRNQHLRDRMIDTSILSKAEHTSLHRDLDELVEIWQDARDAAWDTASEAAWNCDVHSRVLRACLRPYKERVWQYNITRAKPVRDFLPTYAAAPTESRLVDFSINLLPDSTEMECINRLLQRYPDNLQTVTQTIATSVRRRPCIISIETKTDSGVFTAGPQLATWGFAHFRRLATMFLQQATAESSDEEDFLRIHPMIHVQAHEWKWSLLVQRKDGTYDMIYIGSLGGTGDILELWKLRASLGRLAQWGREDWWPAFWEKVVQELQN